MCTLSGISHSSAAHQKSGCDAVEVWTRRLRGALALQGGQAQQNRQDLPPSHRLAGQVLAGGLRRAEHLVSHVWRCADQNGT